MKNLLTYLTGLVFGVGISMSGMANPAKVINFFDVFGTWDPSLAFVMGGAVVVTFFGYRAVFKRFETPAFEPVFNVPTSRVIDARLIGGSAVFGIGWGIAGFCPGGALPAIGTLDPAVLIFFAALVVGIFMAKFMMQRPMRRSR
ncbi:DUF6691 family protein [Celeribacter sp.]|uniref:DUF6691 family protein n=1 Tax=Celeribacter sp. TaxID=1890673 RepID=UPI003A94A34D